MCGRHRYGGEGVLEEVEVPREAELVEEGARLWEGGGCEEAGEGGGVRRVDDEEDEGQLGRGGGATRFHGGR